MGERINNHPPDWAIQRLAHVGNVFSILLLASVLICFAVTGVIADGNNHSETNLHGNDDSGIPKKLERVGKEIGDFVDEQNFKLRITLNPILRQIVCRIAYQSFTRPALVKAMGVHYKAVAEAVDRLIFMGMAKIVPTEGESLVAPYNEKVGQMMRLWAMEWCNSDEACSVSK